MNYSNFWYLFRKNYKKLLQKNKHEYIFKKFLSNNFGMVPTWKTKKGKTSKFVDAGGYNRNETEIERGGIGMGRQRSVVNKNEFTLCSERCKNIKNIYINKYIFKKLLRRIRCFLGDTK